MVQDKILINDLVVRGILGVNEWERREKQDIVINIELRTDASVAARDDDVEQSVNYRTVAKQVIDHVESAERLTVEALAEDIARICLNMPRVASVGVRVEKPGAVRFARSVGIDIQRSQDDLV